MGARLGVEWVQCGYRKALEGGMRQEADERAAQVLLGDRQDLSQYLTPLG